MSDNLSVAIIIQARMGSSRLPGKVLKKIDDLPLLGILVDRLRAKNPDQYNIIVATTIQDIDDPIEKYCHEQDISVCRGSEKDVLGRYCDAIELYRPDIVVRITADCPLIDPDLIRMGVDYLINHYENTDYVSNTVKRTYARGLDFEVFKASDLIEINKTTDDSEDREHVTPYFYKNPAVYKIHQVTCEGDNFEDYRWTVDTSEDFHFVEKVLKHFISKNMVETFDHSDVLDLLSLNPAWREINAHIQQKTLK
ncbi:cytidylyltransferase domain-containing protein [Curvivirga sp.]|uniref:cytidylyltransferase domain-containing protein n=1 Tax=Curvivirga sp. TaxID=2856848 RepID=UPI003B594111